MKQKIHRDSGKKAKTKIASITIIEPSEFKHPFVVRLHTAEAEAKSSLLAQAPVGCWLTQSKVNFETRVIARGQDYIDLALGISAVTAVLDELAKVRDRILGIENDDNDDDEDI